MSPRFVFSITLFAATWLTLGDARAQDAAATAPSPSSALAPAPPLAAPAPAEGATLLLEVEEEDARILLDGRPFEGDKLRKPFAISVGHHVVEAQKPGFRAERREIDAHAGETVGVVLRAVPMSKHAIGYDAPASDSEGSAHGEGYRVPLIVTGTVLSLAGIGLGVAMNLAANTKANDAHAAQAVIVRAGGSTSSCAAPSATLASTCGALQGALTARDRDANLAVVGYAAGGAIAAVTIVYALWPTIMHKERHRWMSMRPTPMVGPSVGGVAIAGVF